MRILKIFSQSQTSILIAAQKALERGGVLVFPTDTVYGLISDAENEKAAKKIFKIKKRDKSKPIPIFVESIEAAKKLAVIDKNQERYLKKYWPGPFAFILKRKKGGKLPKILFGEQETIALRIPDYGLLNKLQKKIGKPLTGTSANISQRPALGKIDEVLKQFDDQKIKPDLIFDAGNLSKRKPSRIIDLTKNKFKIIRH